jgi:integrase
MRAKAGLAPKTLFTETIIIRQLVNYALSRGLVGTDQLKELKIKKPKPTPQPCWTYEELQEILAACSDKLRPPLTLLAETGMRFGELAWLTWDDVDLEKGVLHIRPKDGWKPKTGDQRTVPLSAAARQVLAELTRRHRWVVTAAPSGKYPQGGRQISERRVLAALKRILQKQGLPGKLHTFRHTFISNALLRGVPEAVVRRWVGQVDPEIIKLYTHIHDKASQVAMQRLTDANNRHLQVGEAANDSKRTKDAGSAQIQHTRKEQDDGESAK